MNQHSLDKKLFNAVVNEQYIEAKVLLECGANPNVLLNDGVSPFHLAVGVKSDIEFTKLFLNYKADVNVKSVDNWTPMHVCASWNKPKSLKVLLDHGANPNINNSDKKTPFELAVECNNKECARLIHEHLQLLSEIGNRYDTDTITDKNSNSNNNNNNYNNSSSTKTNETVIERKISKTTEKEKQRPSITSSAKTNTSNNNNNNKSSLTIVQTPSKPELVNIADLEKVINNLIDIKLQEKNIIQSSPTATSSQTSKTPITSPFLKVDSSKNEFIQSTTPTNTPTNGSITSAKNRFHSPETSKRTPITGHKTDDKTSLWATPNHDVVNRISNVENLSIPSVLTLKNNEKYPLSNDSTSSSSTKVFSKIKNLLNKVGNNKTDETSPIHHVDYLCGRNNGLANFCIGSSIHNVNSDFAIDKKFQSPSQSRKQEVNQATNNNNNNEDEIVPVETPKYKAITPKKKHVSLFSEIEKKLANIEKNSIMASINSSSSNHKTSEFNNELKNENEVIYHLDDDNIYFKETTLLTSDESSIATLCQYDDDDDDNFHTANSSSVIYSWDAYDTDKIEKVKEDLLNKTITIKSNEPSSAIKKLTNSELRKCIEEFGDRPGPVTETTRKVYELRLMQLEKNGPTVEKVNNEFNYKNKGFSIDLIDALNNKNNLFNDKIEVLMSNCFQTNTGNWREGHLKASFNYLLIDPRVSNNLPARAKYLDSQEVFRIFIASIFYIGKGTRSRPYAHLYDALKIWKNNVDEIDYRTKDKNKDQSRKIKQIINIWKDNCGVVSLHCFQNVIPCEAYTREAAMIEAMGLQHLTNLKRGDFYGIANSWSLDKKCKLGVLLLKKACDIFIAEGERQIKPIDI